MNINERIQKAYHLSKLNIDIIELLEEIEIELLKTNDLTLESFDLYDKLKYKYDKEYKIVIDTVLFRYRQ